MTLPKAPAEYSQADQAALRAELERIDRRTLKSGQDAALVNGERLILNFAAAITAHAGGGQANATALTADINHVGTVATSGDSVLLPPGVAGRRITIINRGANACQVYGAGTDTIDGVASGTGVSQPAGAKVIYECPAAGTWYSDLAAAAFSGSATTAQTVAGPTLTLGAPPAVNWYVDLTNTSGGAIAVTLPAASLTLGQRIALTDAGGNAGTFTISVKSGVSTLDTIAVNNGWAVARWNGSAWLRSA